MHTNTDIARLTDITQWQPPATSQAPGTPGTYYYHRLFRTSPRTRWWKPLAAFGVFGLVSIVFIALFSLLYLVSGGLPDATVNPTTPGNALYVFGIIIVLLPATLIALAPFRLPMRTLISVTGHFRWKWLGLMVVISLIMFFGAGIIGQVIDGTLSPSTWTPAPAFVESPKAIILAVVLILIVIPLQSLTEEIVFRGFIMQTIGTWVKNPIPAVVVSSLLFAAAHTYGGWTIVGVFLFGVLSAYMAIRTGGIEASFAMHAINNMYATFTGFYIHGEISMDGDLGPAEFATSLAMYAVFIALVELSLFIKRRRGRRLGNTRTVEPDFPNRDGDPDPAAFSAVWMKNSWAIADPAVFSAAMQRYIRFGQAHPSPDQAHAPVTTQHSAPTYPPEQHNPTADPAQLQYNAQGTPPVPPLETPGEKAPTVDQLVERIGDPSPDLTAPPQGTAQSANTDTPPSTFDDPDTNRDTSN